MNNKIVADNTSPHINIEPVLVVEPMHYMEVILLPVMEIMWVERFDLSETGFVRDENILQKTPSSCSYHQRGNCSRGKQILHFLKMVWM